ncbi:hypothetical protein N7E02_07030 (plasmid) [Aliirhizobium terrae]|uniref:hypothetical protein n=1 Tax=Terrirhizobium terrae TaxID=2926709 RepID=UPI0025765687|nr:hypothetical protein [Rhizobium sp. CC-CFT758]WJH38386.1 hypothetical protein N7E02_07030 [Rhizobium sp. CC-CFT758]
MEAGAFAGKKEVEGQAQVIPHGVSKKTPGCVEGKEGDEGEGERADEITGCRPGLVDGVRQVGRCLRGCVEGGKAAEDGLEEGDDDDQFQKDDDREKGRSGKGVPAADKCCGLVQDKITDEAQQP